MNDSELLREYTTKGSEAAFESLVHRHVDLVYSAAFRQVHDATLCGEVTQTVFIILARKAHTLRPGTILSGWLYRTARFAACRALRTELRRRNHEQEAAQMRPEQADSEWEQIAPFLEEGMAHLGDADRNAVVLRYFENKSLKDVGVAFGSDERAAQKRVARAVEKLRVFFAKRGVVLPAIVVATVLSAHAVQAAPAGTAKVATSAALAGGLAAGGSTLNLIKGTLKIMAWSKAKTAVAVGLGVLLVGGASLASWQWMKAWSGGKIDYRVEGTLELAFANRDGLRTKVQNFTVFAKAGQWLIRLPMETNGIDYFEDAFDGTNVYKYTQYQKHLLPSDTQNSSGGTVEANDIPDLGGSTDMVTPIWLAYGGARYFGGISGNKMKSFFFLNRPTPELEQGPYMEVEWKRSKQPPFVPTYIYFKKLNYRYQVLQFTNIAGMTIPSEFLLEYFGPGREVTGPPLSSMHGVLTKISAPAGIQSFRPVLDGRTYTQDKRFAGSWSYLNTNTDWLSTNSPEWRALFKIYSRNAAALRRQAVTK